MKDQFLIKVVYDRKIWVLSTVCGGVYFFNQKPLRANSKPQKIYDTKDSYPVCRELVKQNKTRNNPGQVGLLVKASPCYIKVVGSSLGQDTYKIQPALAGVAQRIECQPANQRVPSSIPSWGTRLGLRARSPVGSAQEATTH